MMNFMKGPYPVLLLITPILLFACKPVFQPSTPEPRAATAIILREPLSLADPTLILTPAPTPTPRPTATQLPSFSFAVFGDSANHNGAGEYDTPHFFRGVVEAMARNGKLAFIVGVGDLTPVKKTDWTIRQTFGADYIWFPVVGNHDLWPGDMNWLRAFAPDLNGFVPPNTLQPGPPDCEETTYSFDYLNTHIVVLNVYCDTHDDIRTDGAIVDSLYEWLAKDLASTKKEAIFIFGHEPAYPQADMDAGIVRHLEDSLDKYPITRDRFWKLLAERKVKAYITGHTHSFSAQKLDGVWQVDVGHAMGIGQQATLSTFVIFRIVGSRATYETFRGGTGDQYTLRTTGELN